VISVHAAHHRRAANSYEGYEFKRDSLASDLARPIILAGDWLARSNEPRRAVIKLTHAPVLVGHMDAASENIAGLSLALVGTLLFFRYGMAHPVRTDGKVDVAHEAAPNTKKWEDVLGWIGLTLVVFGTLVLPAFMR
jgi:hypothetical protein